MQQHETSYVCPFLKKDSAAGLHISNINIKPFTPTDCFRSIQNNERKSPLKLLSVERVNTQILFHQQEWIERMTSIHIAINILPILFLIFCLFDLTVNNQTINSPTCWPPNISVSVTYIKDVQKTIHLQNNIQPSGDIIVVILDCTILKQNSVFINIHIISIGVNNFPTKYWCLFQHNSTGITQ